MHTQNDNRPIQLDIDRNPISEQLSFPFLSNPTDIRWACRNRKFYRVAELPHVYCDGELILRDRTEAEVRGWLLEKKADIYSLSQGSLQHIINECSGDLQPLNLPPVAMSEVNGAASFMLFDIGLEKPLAINAEAFEWLAREGYKLFYQPEKRKKCLALKRFRSDFICGVLMPGDVELTVRQIYQKSLKPATLSFDLIRDNTEVNQREVGAQVSENDDVAGSSKINVTTPGFKTGQHSASEALSILENLYEYDRRSKYTVFTGYGHIDTVIGGLPGGQVAVVAGELITAFLANVVRKNAGRVTNPILTAVCCMQRTIAEFGIKLICMDGNLLVSETRRGMIKERDWCRLSHAAGMLSDQPLIFCDKLPMSIDDLMDGMRSLTKEKPELRLFILESLEMITGDDNAVIAESLRKLKRMADELSITVLIGVTSNVKFKQAKRNVFERYADILLILRKNSEAYTTEIISHEKDDARFDYDDSLRGIVKVSAGHTILVTYPVEVQVRTKEGLLGTASLRYMPQKGVFLNGK